MTPIIIVDGTTEPISVEEAGFNCRAIDDGNSPPTYVEAALLSRLIRSAREACEQRLDMTLVSKTLEVAYDSFLPEHQSDIRRRSGPRNWYDASSLFPWDNWERYRQHGLALPRGPVRSVVSIKYLDVDGNDTPLDPTAYTLTRHSIEARVLPAFGTYWPTARTYPESVRIRYTTGYPSGDSPPQLVPEPIKTAMHLLVAHWYENREAVVPGSTAGPTAEMPLGVCDMLDLYRQGLGV